MRRWFGDGYEGRIRFACLMVAVALGLFTFRRRRKALKKENGTNGATAAQPGVSWLQRLQVSAAQALDVSYDKEAVSTFVGLITNPVRYRSRVAETVALEERVITQRVTVEFALPDAAPNAAARYIPLLAPVKGQLVDNFRLTDASGTSLADLSFEETTKLAATGLRLLLLQALDVGTGSANGPVRTDRPDGMATKSDHKAAMASAMAARTDINLRGLELSLLDQMARRGTVSRTEAAELIDDALDLFPDLLTSQGRQEIREYVLALSVAYPIVAVVPDDAVVGNRTLLHYERALIPRSLNEGGWGFVRMLLGIKPYQIALPVHLAATAASYHLRLNGPPNKYVRGQYFRCRMCKADVKREWEPLDGVDKDSGCYHGTKETVSHVEHITDEDRHFRVRARRGQSFVHLYLRGFGYSKKPQFRQLELFAQFKEVPPGSRAVAVVTALTCTVLVGIIGHLVSQGRAPQTSDVPALMLALPAAAASWFGFSTDGQSLFGSSLLARLSQLMTAVVSFAAIASYFTAHEGHLWFGLSILGIHEPLWALLFVVSALNLLYISYRFALKLRHYNDLVQKDDPHSEVGSLW